MEIDRLPPEVLSLIIGFTAERCDNQKFWLSLASFRSCCLVNRSWLQVTQPLMYKVISLEGSRSLALLHRSLMSSDKLSLLVRQLLFGFAGCEELLPCCRPYSRGEVVEMIAECLERTSRLTDLTFSQSASSYYNSKLVADRLCLLSKLRKFTLGQDSRWGAFEDNAPPGEIEGIEQHEGDGRGPEGRESHREWKETGFDPALLLFLPKSVQELEFCTPSTKVLRVLPRLCAYLNRSGLSTGSQEASESIEAQDLITQQDGLRSLKLRLEADVFGQTSFNRFYQKFYAKLSLSLSLTLTSFSLEDSPPMETETLARLLSATRLLVHLRLHHMDASSNLFARLQPLPRLESFDGSLSGFGPSERLAKKCHRFCRSMIKFISHSPRLHTFGLKCVWYPKRPSDFAGRLICGLVSATNHSGNEGDSQLRDLYLSGAGEVPIDVLEELCRSAPHLRHLSARLPTDEKTRVINAIKSLEQLDRISGIGSRLTKSPNQWSLEFEDSTLWSDDDDDDADNDEERFPGMPPFDYNID